MTSINQADPNLPSISPTNNAFTLKRRHSLRWRLLTLLGAILLVTLLVIGVGVYYFILNTEQRTWRQRQDEAARYAAEVVSTFMERTVSSLNAVGLLDADLLAVHPARRLGRRPVRTSPRQAARPGRRR